MTDFSSAPMSAQRDAAANKLIVALDSPGASQALGIVDALKGEARIFKVGLELIYSDGLVLARAMADAGVKIFLDAKLLDIPNTVERATANISRLGMSFLTVHGTDRKTLDAAVRGRGGNSGTKLLAITVLTSLEQADLAGQGLSMGLDELVLKRAAMAKEAGFDGVIASPNEAAAIRAEIGSDFLIVTPGIRPVGSATGDQQRIATPADAIGAGADYLVVGRPITQAAEPQQAAAGIIAEIAGALPG
jgi:orotidine-5'-phosphate decarboxylase